MFCNLNLLNIVLLIFNCQLLLTCLIFSDEDPVFGIISDPGLCIWNEGRFLKFI